MSHYISEKTLIENHSLFNSFIFIPPNEIPMNSKTDNLFTFKSLH